VCCNKAGINLFRADQYATIKGLYKQWDPLSETFAPPGMPVEIHQKEQLGYVPSTKMLSALDVSIFEDLERQCVDNYKAVAPGPDFGSVREAVRRRLLDLIENSPATLPPGTSILIFGSSGNGFGAPYSDLDMCLALPQNVTLTDPPASMGKLAALLEANGMVEVNARLTARIPIVMFKDSVTGLECDISMQVSEEGEATHMCERRGRRCERKAPGIR